VQNSVEVNTVFAGP